MDAENPTPKEIKQHYSACIDSVNLINEFIAEGFKDEHLTDKEIKECLEANIDHLKIMLERDFWTTEDLTPLKNAIENGDNKLKTL